MAIQKKGLLIGGIVAVVIAAGGICAAVLPDALHKEESSISNGTVTTTTAAPEAQTQKIPTKHLKPISLFSRNITRHSSRINQTPSTALWHRQLTGIITWNTIIKPKKM